MLCYGLFGVVTTSSWSIYARLGPQIFAATRHRKAGDTVLTNAPSDVVVSWAWSRQATVVFLARSRPESKLGRRVQNLTPSKAHDLILAWVRLPVSICLEELTFSSVEAHL